MAQLDTGRKMLSITEARHTYDLSSTYLSLLARQGTIEAVKVGKMWLLYEDSLQQFLTFPRKPGPKGQRGIKPLTSDPRLTDELI